MTDITIKDRLHHNVMVLDLRGVLDIGSLEKLQDFIDLRIKQGHKRFLINFSEIERISSLGLGVLVAIYKSVSRIQGGALALCSLNTMVVDVFRVTRLAGIFNTFENEGDALSAFDVGFENNVETNIRRFKRIPANILIETKVKENVGSDFLSGQALDIEFEGVYIKAAHSYRANDVLDIVLHLPEGAETVSGRVVWIADPDRHPTKYPGIGVHFINISDDLRFKLGKYVMKAEDSEID